VNVIDKMDVHEKITVFGVGGESATSIISLCFFDDVSGLGPTRVEITA